MRDGRMKSTKRLCSPPIKPQAIRKTIRMAATQPERTCHSFNALSSSDERNASAIVATKTQ
jgi:hypothetical protein